MTGQLSALLLEELGLSHSAAQLVADHIQEIESALDRQKKLRAELAFSLGLPFAGEKDNAAFMKVLCGMKSAAFAHAADNTKSPAPTTFAGPY